MIYLAINNGQIEQFFTLEDLERNGLEIVMKVTPEDWDTSERIARLVKGKIVLGRTKEEKAAEKAMLRIDLIDKELSELNVKQSRSSAEIAMAIAQGKTPPEEALTYHAQREEQAVALRAERAGLVGR